ncbi:hypothetical protein C4K68_28210 [Pokkaliibacter plantistimulans]|uniref:DUF4198 domain-containing protein n=1 Tax=Proteobacteria bacterium 228 TaxID=2083153 RepID=A0A2S5KGS2_9PROT|nr:hypothetical protein [Pokkaliibacter plantistimulans]PPC74004.1 hypothetical protein C4K68_28210 [Pokkaliibacter plantistimulans]
MKKYKLSLILTALCTSSSIFATELPIKDQIVIFGDLSQQHMAGVAQKTKVVDARPAVVGEEIITRIKGEGVETKSKPAEEGDWVVRNRCPETGNEEYLVKKAKFGARYHGPESEADAEGYSAFSPVGKEVNYIILPESLGSFQFKAPWGEMMIAKPGDALVQSPSDSADTYRVAAQSFSCTYNIITPANTTK